MPDLDERLRAVDRVTAPDLWDRIEHGSGAPGRHGGRKLAVILAAAAIALPAIVALVFAFGGSRDAAPAIEPKVNGLIAYAKGAGGGNGVDIFLTDPTTGETVDLTNTPGVNERAPTWSPDGLHVAFVSKPRPHPGDTGVLGFRGATLDVMNRDGTGLQVVRTCRSRICGSFSVVSWSPDGTKLAWVGSQGMGGRIVQTVRMYDLATRTTTDVCGPDDCGDGSAQPTWSPDGRELAFSNEGVFTEHGIGTYPSSIWVANADGSGVRRLTPGLLCTDAGRTPCYADTDPAWSPDGRWIAFSRSDAGFRMGTRPPESHVGLFIVSTDGSEPSAARALASCEPDVCGQQVYPSWSPDGTRVAFLSRFDGSQIGVVDVQSGAIRQIPVGSVPACRWVGFPSWSPDGTQILYQSVAEPVSNLCTAPADGSAPHVVVRNVDDDANPAWLPSLGGT